MTISPELLAAFVDGELSEFDAARVRRAIADDPQLAEQVVQLQQLSGLLSARFDPILDQPVPERLTRPIEDAAKVVDLGAVRAARQRWFERPLVRYAGGSTIAACLIAFLMVGRNPAGSGADYAAPQLATALDTALSGETASDGTRPLLSFRTAAGEACRAYSGNSGGGIACRDSKGWKLRMTGAKGEGQQTQYQQAGSDDAAIMAAAQEMAASPALDRAAEEAARSEGWRQTKP
jgi:hypothetical protein